MPEISTDANQLLKDITEQLGIAEPQEKRAYALMVAEKLFGLSNTDVIVGKAVVVSKQQQQELNKILAQLNEGTPIQYVLQEAWFYDRAFYVNSKVLIPRPETEELVHHIVNDLPEIDSLLDVGTGTGCIPITLQLERSVPHAFGLDVSQGALDVARHNAKKLGADVQWLQADVLTYMPELANLDLVVSNPPYVRTTEMKEMHSRVTQFEPHLALFVPDHDPLKFYTRITQLATRLLAVGGYLYFEINEAFGPATQQLVAKAGFANVKLVQDIHGKDRFVTGCWHGPQ